MNYTRSSFILGALLSLVLAGCGTAPATPANLVVTAADFRFTPSTLTLTSGQPVTLIFKNAGKTLHDFHIISGPGVPTAQPEMPSMSEDHQHDGPYHIAAEPNQQATLTLTLASGTYTFICSVVNHRQLGMQGTIRCANCATRPYLGD
jgi:uncharacterized cupredoxin-like copper-binding protein